MLALKFQSFDQTILAILGIQIVKFPASLAKKSPGETAKRSQSSSNDSNDIQWQKECPGGMF